MSLDVQSQRTLRAGFTFNFRGNEPDADGKPTGELIDIELVVPPLNFDSLKLLQARLQKMGNGPDTDSMETLVDALEQALARNYRNVPRWLITQTVDVGNMGEMMLALMNVSGLKAREEGGTEKKVMAPETAQMNGTATVGTSSTAS
jgi:hypothetical protein